VQQIAFLQNKSIKASPQIDVCTDTTPLVCHFSKYHKNDGRYTTLQLQDAKRAKRSRKFNAGGLKKMVGPLKSAL
jgi:hypothetical protein